MAMVGALLPMHHGRLAAQAHVMTTPLDIPMDRMRSGTTWVPDAAPIASLHGQLGRWDFTGHGLIFLQYIDASLGYIRDFARGRGMTLGLGVRGSVGFAPSAIESSYGSRHPVGGTVFLRIRPARIPMSHDMEGMQGMRMRQ